MIMRHMARLGTVLAASLLLLACAASGPRYSYDVPGAAVAASAVRIASSSSSRHIGNVDATLAPMFADAMRGKGYTVDGAAPALELVFEVRAQFRQEVLQKPVVSPAGTFSRAEFVSRHEGAIAVLVRDLQSNRTVYTASVAGEVDPGITHAGLQAVVEGLIARMPAAPRP